MGILTLLRNAFGRSRKGRDADAETSREVSAPTVPAPATEPVPSSEEAERVPVQETAEPKIPSPSPEPTPETKPSVVEELVSAAFDNVTVPKPTPTPEAETVEATETAVAEATPEAEPEPEPVAEVEVEPVAEPEPVAEAVVEVAPEPVAEEAPAAEPEPEPVAEVAAAEPEPVVAEEPAPLAAQADEPASAQADEPVAAQADAPAVADGDQAPQGPPAGDDESSTGGAGGKTDEAEGEAEAEPEPTAEETTAEGEAEAEPEPTAEETTAEGEAEAEPEPTAEEIAEPEPEAAAEAPGQPAVPLTHVRTRAPGLVTAYKEAGTALRKRDLTGTRANLYLVLDRSASMRPYYKDGSAQALGEQALALAAHLDPESTVHVVFFSTELDGTGELTLTEHENKIDDLHAGLGRMGRTSYHAAVQEVLTHHEKHHPDSERALVIFQTDGAPDAKTPATQSLTDAAKDHPTVFFSFIAFGEHDNKAFDYLRKLKTENTAFFHAGPTPRELTDAEVYEGVLANWRP
ncbi:VWA domain-containing protein [Streptomyces sp. R41]|uniref:VWA domain-containing protein n=1 Tax=Streptomyces sp. R41 TaxID=3238632 RepID=A0AB39RKQ2_9ACTN